MKGVSYGILSLIGLVPAAMAADAKCHALAMSGGANKGAFEAGAIWQLADKLTVEEVSW